MTFTIRTDLPTFGVIPMEGSKEIRIHTQCEKRTRLLIIREYRNGEATRQQVAYKLAQAEKITRALGIASGNTNYQIYMDSRKKPNCSLRVYSDGNNNVVLSEWMIGPYTQVETTQMVCIPGELVPQLALGIERARRS